MREEWVALDGLVENGENYKVSCRGRVWSDKTKRILKPAKSTNGYIFVSLSQRSKKKQYDVHRLVAIAFLKERRTDQTEVNHKDGVKTNNQKENLEWVSSSENNKHAYATGLRHPLPKENTISAIQANRKPVIKRELESHRVVGVYRSAVDLGKLSQDAPRRTVSYQCQNNSTPQKSKYYHRFATADEIEAAKSDGIYFEAI